MRLILFSFVVLSNFIFAQTDSIKIDSVKVNVVDSIKRSNEIDEVTITQFYVKKLNSPISTDVYSQQFFRKIQRPVFLNL
jgi:outer membrane receptor for ferrienterochelin and colicins